MWQWNKFFSEYFGFPLSLSCHQCSILIFNYMLRLPEGQMNEAWERSKNQCSFSTPAALAVEVLSLVL
jgi:hypothetical protein